MVYLKKFPKNKKIYENYAALQSNKQDFPKNHKYLINTQKIKLQNYNSLITAMKSQFFQQIQRTSKK